MDLFFNPKYAEVYKKIDGNSETYVFNSFYGSVKYNYILREVDIKINNEIYYDIVTPYGYGGPLAENVKDIKLLMQEFYKSFSDYCLQHNIICEFIRFHLYDNIDIRENYYGEAVYSRNNVVVNTSGDFENDIWGAYERKVRKNVRKAEKNNLCILIESNLSHISDFLEIYDDTMDRNNAEDYYYFDKSYFENIEKLLPDNFMYFYVLKGNKIISTELVLYSGRYAYSFLGGTLTDYYEYRPNDFLKNEIIKWANKKGIEKFILGGGYHNDDGIYKYKRGFTKDPDVQFYIGKYIFNQEIYDKIVEKRKSTDSSFDNSSQYFPLYRS